jgi:hypothetical protein
VFFELGVKANARGHAGVRKPPQMKNGRKPLNFGVADGTRTHDNRNHNPGTYAKKSSTYAQFVEDSTPWEAAPVLEAIGHLLWENSACSFCGHGVN